MAQNIFDATLDPNNDIKVNNFDWSHANNLTTQIGRITPIFCDMVPAKTSFRVNPRFGLQFMPMVFPIQTRMKARIMWFRYPLRALWKDYKDFVGNFREGLEEPYLDINTQDKIKRMVSTGSLGDYLGIPSTLIGSYGGSVSVESDFSETVTINGTLVDKALSLLVYPYMTISEWQSIFASTPEALSRQYIFDKYKSTGQFTTTASTASFIFALSGKLPSSTTSLVFRDKNAGLERLPGFDVVAVILSGDTAIGVTKVTMPSDGAFSVDLSGVNASNVTDVVIIVPTNQSNEWFTAVSVVASANPRLYAYNSTVQWVMTYNREPEFVQDISLAQSPWYNSSSENKDKQQKLLAYAFRAYEGIYNSFIRDNRNNPYYLNGQVQYNKWIPTDEGGADSTIYELHYANWEKDFLTTAVQSPQQGNAPLVGITTYTQTVQNEDGTRTELIKTSLVDEDGKKYGLSFTESEEGLEGVEYVELDNGTQVRQARSLYDLATSGISIPDLRMVNCYQKFLELNMRKGYSYKDIVEGRFDVKVRYADLLMPEFFGGVSRDIDVNSVTQTVDNNAVSGSGDYATALGSQSGLAGVRGEANANIECFCDEESIIMGLLIVTPLPVYTQLLPKHFTYRGLMEHYQPEFNLIGFQPIKYNEVCPIQAFNDNPDSLTETFGYNRPWYEFAQKYDVAHGLFRTSLSNFLMHRVFDQKPQLAQSFLTVDPEQVTDVFAVTETTDKIYGQIWLDITCKLPIARVAIPRLD